MSSTLQLPECFSSFLLSRRLFGWVACWGVSASGTGNVRGIVEGTDRKYRERIEKRSGTREEEGPEPAGWLAPCGRRVAGGGGGGRLEVYTAIGWLRAKERKPVGTAYSILRYHLYSTSVALYTYARVPSEKRGTPPLTEVAPMARVLRYSGPLVVRKSRVSEGEKTPRSQEIPQSNGSHQLCMLYICPER